MHTLPERPPRGYPTPGGIMAEITANHTDEFRTVSGVSAPDLHMGPLAPAEAMAVNAPVVSASGDYRSDPGARRIRRGLPESPGASQRCATTHTKLALRRHTGSKAVSRTVLGCRLKARRLLVHRPGLRQLARHCRVTARVRSGPGPSSGRFPAISVQFRLRAWQLFRTWPQLRQ